jgi:geranylgeranyl pyrophosphate synthase
MMLTMAFGQYLDVQGPKDEEDYWRMVATKSSPFFGSVLYVGALMGGATREDALQIERFGNLYGEMIQIHDDLNDAMAVPANPDWRLDRSPLPILFAQGIEHTEKERFLELRQNISDPVALTEAQTTLIRCGASATVLTNCYADIKRLKRSWMRFCYLGGKDSKIYWMALLRRRKNYSQLQACRRQMAYWSPQT